MLSRHIDIQTETKSLLQQLDEGYLLPEMDKFLQKLPDEGVAKFFSDFIFSYHEAVKGSILMIEPEKYFNKAVALDERIQYFQKELSTYQKRRARNQIPILTSLKDCFTGDGKIVDEAIVKEKSRIDHMRRARKELNDKVYESVDKARKVPKNKAGGASFPIGYSTSHGVKPAFRSILTYNSADRRSGIEEFVSGRIHFHSLFNAPKDRESATRCNSSIKSVLAYLVNKSLENEGKIPPSTTQKERKKLVVTKLNLVVKKAGAQWLGDNEQPPGNLEESVTKLLNAVMDLLPESHLLRKCNEISSELYRPIRIEASTSKGAKTTMDARVQMARKRHLAAFSK